MGLTLVQIPFVKTRNGTATYEYVAGSIWITGSTANFADWYTADQAGGWGTIDRNSTDDYYLNAENVDTVYIGNSTHNCTFSDYSKQVDFNYVYWEIANNSTLQFGRVTSGKARDGVQVYGNSYFTGLVGSVVYFYGVSMKQGNLVLQGTNILRGCQFINVYLAVKNTDLDQCVLNNAYFKAISDETSGDINNVFCWGSYLIWITHNYNVSLSNIVVNPTYLMGTFAGETWSGNVNLTNVESTTWAMDWNDASDTGEVWRKYTYDLTVTYPNGTTINGTETGARVVIQHYGQGGGIDYNATLGGDGKIPMQNLTMGFYNYTGGNTRYDWNNYNLQVYNVSGYAEYNGNFTLNGKTSLTVVLHEPEGYAGFVFFFLGLIMALVIGGLVGYGSGKK